MMASRPWLKAHRMGSTLGQCITGNTVLADEVHQLGTLQLTFLHRQGSDHLVVDWYIAAPAGLVISAFCISVANLSTSVILRPMLASGAEISAVITAGAEPADDVRPTVGVDIEQHRRYTDKWRNRRGIPEQGRLS